MGNEKSVEKLEIAITFLIALVSVTSTIVGYLGSDAYGNESREHSRGLNNLTSPPPEPGL